MIYDKKGGADSFLFNLITGSSETTDYSLNYLSVPLTANWHFGGKRQWYLNFGPYVGFLLNAESTEANIDVTDGFSSIDAGLAIGIGYQFEISQSTKLYVEYEGQGGVIDVFENNEGSTGLNSRTSINLGILFGI